MGYQSPGGGPMVRRQSIDADFAEQRLDDFS
jgi:hypothetical protein